MTSLSSKDYSTGLADAPRAWLIQEKTIYLQ